MIAHNLTYITFIVWIFLILGIIGIYQIAKKVIKSKRAQYFATFIFSTIFLIATFFVLVIIFGEYAYDILFLEYAF